MKTEASNDAISKVSNTYLFYSQEIFNGFDQKIYSI